MDLSSRQGTKTKQKGRIYDRFLKVHGDNEDADIFKKGVDRCIPCAPLNSIIILN
jgi:hypothetical protein